VREKKFRWHKIAEHVNEIGLAANNIAEIEVNGKKVCIGRHNDQLFAFAHKCPHAGGLLADGFIDRSGNIVCPVHRHRYDLRNGRNTSGEGYFLKNWPVEMRADGVFIGMDEGIGFWNLI